MSKFVLIRWIEDPPKWDVVSFNQCEVDWDFDVGDTIKVKYGTSTSPAAVLRIGEYDRGYMSDNIMTGMVPTDILENTGKKMVYCNICKKCSTTICVTSSEFIFIHCFSNFHTQFHSYSTTTKIIMC